MIVRYHRPIMLAAVAAFLGMTSGLVWFLFSCELDRMLIEFDEGNDDG